MSKFPMLVADIGGTNARFSIVSGKDDQGYTIGQFKELSTGQYETLEAALEDYLDSIAGEAPVSACVAIAAPVTGDLITMTNNSWQFSMQVVKQSFGFKRFEVLNDFAALANSVPHLAEDNLVEIVAGEDRPGAPKVVIGPGTGLGVAGLVRCNGHWRPVPGQGGFTAYAPQNQREMAIAQRLQKDSYLCTEDLISGRGLVTLFNTMALLDGVDIQASEAKDVSAMAFEQENPLALEALELFCAGLGTVAGDIALIYAAKGGIYLGGGILPRMVDYLKTSGFEARLKHRGKMTELINNIPVYLINHPHPALVGAAAWLDLE